MKRFLFHTANAFFISSSAIVLVILLLQKSFSVTNILFFAIAGALFYLIVKTIKEGNKKKKLIFYLDIGLLFFEVFFSYNLLFAAGWDSSTLTWGSFLNVFGEDPKVLRPEVVFDYTKEYLDYYPNNLLMVGYLMLSAFTVRQLGKGFMSYTALTILENCFIYTLSGHLLYRCVEKLTKSTSLPVFAWILFTILLGTSPWVVVVYSDSLALFIPILVLCLLLKEEMNPYGKTVLIGLLSILAFYIKPQAFLILVAVVIIYAIEHISHGNWKRLGIEALILVLSFAAVILPVNAFKEENLEAEKEIGFPHYLLIGANYDTIGSYSAKDLEYSMSFKTKEERNEADLEALKDRLEDYGPAKVFDHLVRKTAFTYNDGTFAFGKEGNFYQEFFSLHMPFEKQFRDVFLDIGPYYLYPTIIRQIAWFLVLIGGIFAWKGEDDVLPLRVLKVTLFGLFLFELLFEARARYLIVCVPLFIVLCAEGMNRVLKKK